jgi:hypothetical protein
MKKVKLTMVLENDIVDAARRVSDSRRISLTHLVREFFMSLKDKEKANGRDARVEGR